MKTVIDIIEKTRGFTMTETINDLNELTKDELLAACEQFGVDFKKSMSKADLVASLTEDGVTTQLIRGYADTVEEIEPVEDFDEPEAADAPVDDDEDVVLVRMTRANNTYQIRGYTFKSSHPFALVKEEDADFLIEKDGGFRMASPKEAKEFYS